MLTTVQRYRYPSPLGSAKPPESADVPVEACRLKLAHDHADDVVIRRDGATVLVDQISVGYLGGSEIDFVDDLIGASFRINNPKATASCGCGTSFSL